MKYLVLLLSMFQAVCYGQNAFTIRCDIKGAKGHKIYLADSYGGYLNPQNPYSMDSIIPNYDTFSFYGTFKDYKYYSLLIDTSERYTSLIIDTGILKIKGTAAQFGRLYVSSTQNEWRYDLGDLTNDILLARNKVADLIWNDTVNKIKHRTTYDSLTTAWENVLEPFIKAHPDSYDAFGYLEIGNRPEDIEWQKRVFSFFSERIRNSEEGRQFHYKYFQYNTDSIIAGAFPIVEAFNINQEQKNIRLNPDSVYFIDYWASWCVPCIEKLPGIKKLYMTYKVKGFNVVSFSMDWKYENWIKAVKKHKIPWANYSALKGFNADDARYFNITSIPYIILIGKDNKIVKLNPTEEEVENYLKTFLK